MILYRTSRSLVLSYRKIISSRVLLTDLNSTILPIGCSSRRNTSSVSNEEEHSPINDTLNNASPAVNPVRKFKKALLNFFPQFGEQNHVPASKALRLINQRPKASNTDSSAQSLIKYALRKMPHPTQLKSSGLSYRLQFENCVQLLFNDTNRWEYFHLLNSLNLDISSSTMKKASLLMMGDRLIHHRRHLLQILDSPEGSTLRLNQKFLAMHTQFCASKASPAIMLMLKELEEDMHGLFQRSRAEEEYLKHYKSTSPEEKYTAASQFMKFILEDASTVTEMHSNSWHCRVWKLLPPLQRASAVLPSHIEFIRLFDEAVPLFKSLLSAGYEAEQLNEELSKEPVMKAKIISDWSSVSSASLAAARLSVDSAVQSNAEKVAIHNVAEWKAELPSDNVSAPSIGSDFVSTPSSRKKETMDAVKIGSNLSNVMMKSAPINVKPGIDTAVKKIDTTPAVGIEPGQPHSRKGNHVGQVDQGRSEPTEYMKKISLAINKLSLIDVKNVVEHELADRRQLLTDLHFAVNQPVNAWFKIDRSFGSKLSEAFDRVYPPSVLKNCDSQYKLWFEECAHKLILVASPQQQLRYYQMLRTNKLRIPLDAFDAVCKAMLERPEADLYLHLLERSVFAERVEDRIDATFIDKQIKYCHDYHIAGSQVDTLLAMKHFLEHGEMPKESVKMNIRKTEAARNVIHLSSVLLPVKSVFDDSKSMLLLRRELLVNMHALSLTRPDLIRIFSLEVFNRVHNPISMLTCDEMYKTLYVKTLQEMIPHSSAKVQQVYFLALRENGVRLPLKQFAELCKSSLLQSKYFSLYLRDQVALCPKGAEDRMDVKFVDDLLQVCSDQKAEVSNVEALKSLRTDLESGRELSPHTCLISVKNKVYSGLALQDGVPVLNRLLRNTRTMKQLEYKNEGTYHRLREAFEGVKLPDGRVPPEYISLRLSVTKELLDLAVMFNLRKDMAHFKKIESDCLSALAVSSSPEVSVGLIDHTVAKHQMDLHSPAEASVSSVVSNPSPKLTELTETSGIITDEIGVLCQRLGPAEDYSNEGLDKLNARRLLLMRVHKTLHSTSDLSGSGDRERLSEAFRAIYEPVSMLECDAKYRNLFEEAVYKFALSLPGKEQFLYYQKLRSNFLRVPLDLFEVVCKTIIDDKNALQRHLVDRIRLPESVQDRVGVDFVNGLLKYCTERGTPAGSGATVLESLKSAIETNAPLSSLSRITKHLEPLFKKTESESESQTMNRSIKALNTIVGHSSSSIKFEAPSKSVYLKLLKLFKTIPPPWEASLPQFSRLYYSAAFELSKLAALTKFEAPDLDKILLEFRSVGPDASNVASTNKLSNPIDVPVVAVAVEQLSVTPTVTKTEAVAQAHTAEKPITKKERVVREKSHKRDSLSEARNNLKVLVDKLNPVSDLIGEAPEIQDTRRQLLSTLHSAMNLPLSSQNKSLVELCTKSFNRVYQPNSMVDCDSLSRQNFEAVVQKLLMSTTGNVQMMYFQVLREHGMRIPLECFEKVCKTVLHERREGLRQFIVEMATLPEAMEDRVSVDFLDKMIKYCSDNAVRELDTQVLGSLKTDLQNGKTLPTFLPLSGVNALLQSNELKAAESVRGLNLIVGRAQTMQRLSRYNKPQIIKLQNLMKLTISPHESLPPGYSTLYKKALNELIALSSQINHAHDVQYLRTLLMKSDVDPRVRQFNDDFDKIMAAKRRVSRSKTIENSASLLQLMLNAFESHPDEFAKPESGFVSKLVDAYFTTALQPIDIMFCDSSYSKLYEKCTHKLMLLANESLHQAFYLHMRLNRLEISLPCLEVFCKTALRLDSFSRLQQCLTERIVYAKLDENKIGVEFIDRLLQFCSENGITKQVDDLHEVKNKLASGVPMHSPVAYCMMAFVESLPKRGMLNEKDSVRALNIINNLIEKNINKRDFHYIVEVLWRIAAPAPEFSPDYKRLYGTVLENLIVVGVQSKAWDEVSQLFKIIVEENILVKIQTVWWVAQVYSELNDRVRFDGLLRQAAELYGHEELFPMLESLIEVCAPEHPSYAGVAQRIYDEIKMSIDAQKHQSKLLSEILSINESLTAEQNQIQLPRNEYDSLKSFFDNASGGAVSNEFNQALEILCNRLLSEAGHYQDWQFVDVIYSQMQSRNLVLTHDAWINACVGLLHLKQHSRVAMLYRTLYPDEPEVNFDLRAFRTDLISVCRELGLPHLVEVLQKLVEADVPEVVVSAVSPQSKPTIEHMELKLEEPVLESVDDIYLRKKERRRKSVNIDTTEGFLTEKVNEPRSRLTSTSDNLEEKSRRRDEIASLISTVEGRDDPEERLSSNNAPRRVRSSRRAADLLNFSDDLPPKADSDKLRNIGEVYGSKFSSMLLERDGHVASSRSSYLHSDVVNNLWTLMNDDSLSKLTVPEFQNTVGCSIEECLSAVLRYHQQAAESAVGLLIMKLYDFLCRNNVHTSTSIKVNVYQAAFADESASDSSLDAIFNDLVSTGETLPTKVWITRFSQLLRRNDAMSCFVELERLHHSGYHMTSGLYAPVLNYYKRQRDSAGVEAVQRMIKTHESPPVDAIRTYNFSSPDLVNLPVRVANVRKQELTTFVEQIKDFIKYDTAPNCFHFLEGLYEDNFLMSCELYEPVMRYYLDENRPWEAKRCYDLMMSHGVMPTAAMQKFALEEMVVKLPKCGAAEESPSTVFDAVYNELEAQSENTQLGWYGKIRDLMLHGKPKHVERMLSSLEEAKFPLTSDHYYPLMLHYYEIGAFEEMRRVYGMMIKSRVAVNGNVKKLMQEYNQRQSAPKKVGDEALDPLLSALIAKSSKGRSVKEVNIVFDTIYQELIVSKKNTSEGWIAEVTKQLSQNHLENAVYLLTSMHKAGFSSIPDYMAPVMMFCYQKGYFSEFNVLLEMIKKYGLHTNPSIELLKLKYDQELRQSPR